MPDSKGIAQMLNRSEIFKAAWRSAKAISAARMASPTFAKFDNSPRRMFAGALKAEWQNFQNSKLHAALEGQGDNASRVAALKEELRCLPYCDGSIEHRTRALRDELRELQAA